VTNNVILALVVLDRAVNLATFALIGVALASLTGHVLRGGKFTP
jgi:hypothetical protein